MKIIQRALGEVMACPIAETMGMAKSLMLMQNMVIMVIIPRAMEEAMGCPIAETMDTTKGLLMLKLKQRQMQRLKLSTITMDITPRKVTAPLMVATTKGLLKRNRSSITTDMGIINLRALAMDIRGEVSCPEISSPRSPITTTTTNEVLRIPAQIWSVER